MRSDDEAGPDLNPLGSEVELEDYGAAVRFEQCGVMNSKFADVDQSVRTE